MLHRQPTRCYVCGARRTRKSLRAASICGISNWPEYYCIQCLDLKISRWHDGYYADIESYIKKPPTTTKAYGDPPREKAIRRPGRKVVAKRVSKPRRGHTKRCVRQYNTGDGKVRRPKRGSRPKGRAKA